MKPDSLPGLLDCMHCGLCLQSCPTYRLTGKETDSPRGRLALLRAEAEGRISHSQIQESLNRCLQCGACETVCPSAVPYQQLLTHHKEATTPQRQRRRLSFLFSSRRRLRWLGALARFARRCGFLRWFRPYGTSVLHRLAQAVPQQPKKFRFPPAKSFAAHPPQRGTVSLHLGCVDPELFGEVLEDTIAVLCAEGFEVKIPSQPACCGALEAHGGAHQHGVARAQATLQALSNTDAIIAPAAGCAAFLHEFGQDKVWDPMAFLAAQGLRNPLHPIAESVVFDPPCHQQNLLHSSEATRQLLSAIPQLRLLPHQDADLCCGAAGIQFMRSPRLSMELGAEKAKHLLAAKADRVLNGNSGCRIQIESALRGQNSQLPVQHPICLLRQAMLG